MAPEIERIKFLVMIEPAIDKKPLNIHESGNLLAYERKSLMVFSQDLKNLFHQLEAGLLFIEKVHVIHSFGDIIEDEEVLFIP